VNPEDVETNMVILRTDNLKVNAHEFIEELRNSGVLANAVSNTEIRLVTHKDVSGNDIEEALNIFEKLFRTFS
jgi:threonine aldolase